MTMTEVLHLRIFGHEMSDKMRKFLKNFSWSSRQLSDLDKNKIGAKIDEY